MSVSAQCPACVTKLRPFDGAKHDRIILRSCAKCAVQWRMRVRPFAYSKSLGGYEVTFCAVRRGTNTAWIDLGDALTVDGLGFGEKGTG